MALSAQTPLRNIRHLLARIERSYQACKEAEYKLKKLSLRKETKERDRDKEKDELKKKILEIEIEEISHKIKSAMFYFEGAVKKIQHNYNCIQQIMDAKGYSSFDEIDFEKEEEEYHIKTAINQSVRCVRQTGRIDLGNQEYLEQCGINPAMVQHEILVFLQTEQSEIKHNTASKTTRRLYEFIDKMYNKFKGQSEKRIADLGVKKPFMESVMFKVSKAQKQLLKPVHQNKIKSS